jgi:hypothetical protein
MANEVEIRKISDLGDMPTLLDEALLIIEDPNIPQTQKTTLEAILNRFNADKIEGSEGTHTIYWTGAETGPSDIVVHSFAELADYMSTKIFKDRARVEVVFPETVATIDAGDTLLDFRDTTTFLHFTGHSNKTKLNINVTSASVRYLFIANNTILSWENFEVDITKDASISTPSYAVFTAFYNGYLQAKNTTIKGYFKRALYSNYHSLLMCWGGISIYAKENNNYSVVSAEHDSTIINWGMEIDNYDQDANVITAAQGIKASDGGKVLLQYGLSIKNIDRAVDAFRLGGVVINANCTFDNLNEGYALGYTSSIAVNVTSPSYTNVAELYPSGFQINRYRSDGTIIVEKSGAMGEHSAYTSELVNSGDTASRPATPLIGFSYFDTDLNKPIWFDGTNWVDATGTTV